MLKACEKYKCMYYWMRKYKKLNINIKYINKIMSQSNYKLV